MHEPLRSLKETDALKGLLIIVSNREPYIHNYMSKRPNPGQKGEGIKVERPAGGLTSALDGVMRNLNGIWVAWGSGSADKEEVDKDDSVRVPPEDPSYSLKRVWLSQNEVENYYHGYSNQVLWPLCHITLDRVYHRRRFFEEYKKVNEKFCKAVLEVVHDNNHIVWIHDYHFCLLPNLLRQKRGAITIAHFWHIPWPDWSVFRVCPQAKELIEGLLGNDLIGLQIPLFVKNFFNCVSECLDAEIDYKNSIVTYKGHTTTVKAFPISIDYERFNHMASSVRTERMIKRIKATHRLEGGYIGIGVDRLEYTKALVKRMQALMLFFEKYKRFRERFTFIQVAVPTRMKEPYISYKQTVEAMVKRINDRFAKGEWRPIIYIDTKIEQEDLVAYYRMADLAIISSVYDGMNLVAKEFIASQIDKKGVLLLSEFAGAAEELLGGIIINPYDIEGFAGAISTALKMKESEKRLRIDTLRRFVRQNDINKWIYDLLAEMNRLYEKRQSQPIYIFDNLEAFKKGLKDKDIALFLDYDGTLTPIVDTPDKAYLPFNIKEAIESIKGQIPVAIVTGRSLSDIMERVGISGIVYTGNHGAEIYYDEKVFIGGSTKEGLSDLKAFLEDLKGAISAIPGVMIEDKTYSASIHYRNVDNEHLSRLFCLFWRQLEGYKARFTVNQGKMVFEVRPKDMWNKGDAVRWIIENPFKGRYPVYIGDDTTDEDAYRAIKGMGISISVGENPYADYLLKDQLEVGPLLESIKEALCL